MQKIIYGQLLSGDITFLFFWQFFFLYERSYGNLSNYLKKSNYEKWQIFPLSDTLNSLFRSVDSNPLVPVPSNKEYTTKGVPFLNFTFPSILKVTIIAIYLLICVQKLLIQSWLLQQSRIQLVMYYFKNECEGLIRFPNTRKHLKPRGRRPSGFIVFECLET